MLKENEVLCNGFLEVYPGRVCYEADVPANFTRPCFLFLNPAHESRVQILSAALCKISGTYTVFGFVQEEEQAKAENIDRITELTKMAQSISAYFAGEPKLPIPGSDNRYLTVDGISCKVDEASSVCEFTFVLSHVEVRARRRKPSEKVRMVDVKLSVVDEGVVTQSHTIHTEKEAF